MSTRILRHFFSTGLGTAPSEVFAGKGTSFPDQFRVIQYGGGDSIVAAMDPSEPARQFAAGMRKAIALLQVMIQKVASWPDEGEVAYKFAVLAEAKDDRNILYLHDLSFERLIDDVVYPYQEGNAFFVDGVPLKRETIGKLKIIAQRPDFSTKFERFHLQLRNDVSVQNCSVPRHSDLSRPKIRHRRNHRDFSGALKGANPRRIRQGLNFDGPGPRKCVTCTLSKGPCVRLA